MLLINKFVRDVHHKLEAEELLDYQNEEGEQEHGVIIRAI